MDNAIAPCPWEYIKGFDGWKQFNEFIEWMNERVTDGHAIEVHVASPYVSDSMFIKEKWFKHLKSGEVWRLVYPAPPFPGLFQRVEDE